MIPDKVYIHIGPHLEMMQATGIRVGAPGEEEYIRKDYLLEKLKDLREYYFDLFRNTGMEEYNIRTTTMDYLINKMEEI